MTAIDDTAAAEFLLWRPATENALYGVGGFYRTRVLDRGPAAHFRTSPHVSPQFGTALWRLVGEVDAVLGHPERLEVVDMAAGGGELLATLHSIAASTPASTDTAQLGRRVRFTGVEIAPRPGRLNPDIEWRSELGDLTGVLIANEWLDNVPIDVVELDDDGVTRLVEVHPATGAQRLGEPIGGPDAAWLRQWWPLRRPGDRAELGQPRSDAWADAVSRVRAGLAVAIDYGHLRGDRPPLGSIAGYRDGAQVSPIPDGTCDITAAVAIDAVASTGAVTTPGNAAHPDGEPILLSQRTALRALGVTGARPPRELASTHPSEYLAALARAGEAGELIDPTGLGRFWWLAQPVGLVAAHRHRLAQRLGVTPDVSGCASE